MKHVLSSEYNLQSEYPELALEWYQPLNGEVTPKDVLPGCNKKFSWQCKENPNHIWEASPNKRTSGRGCPFCAHRKVSIEQSLQVLSPEIALEWDYSKNSDKPEDNLNFSNSKKYWICKKCGYSWKTAISNRTKNGSGCPLCSNQIIKKGVNDLVTLNPLLASEWATEINKIAPDTVGIGTPKKYAWKCMYGHVWYAAVNQRSKGSGCPHCQKLNKTSLQEKIIFFYIRQYHSDAISNFHEEWLNRKEIDIYIPSLKIGLEYDGQFWHKNVKNDLEKDDICAKNGIDLIRIREPGCPSISRPMPTYVLVSLEMSHLETVISDVLAYLGDGKHNISIADDYQLILSEVHTDAVSNNLKTKYPEIAAELKPDFNHGINAESIPATGSKKKFVWQCSKCGGTWQATLESRLHGRNCPYCAGRKILKGYNDLATVNPILAADWEYDLNKTLTPDMVTAHSKKVVAWKCSNGHVWEEQIDLRTRGYNCPYCSGKRLLVGWNDLATEHPELAKEWANENALSPCDVTSGSSYKARWLCSTCGHQWEAPIYSRTAGFGCPKCGRKKQSNSHQKTIEQFSEDLHRIHPNLDIIGEYTNNHTPVKIICNKCGNVWSDYPKNLTLNKRGCRICKARSRETNPPK